MEIKNCLLSIVIFVFLLIISGNVFAEDAASIIFDDEDIPTVRIEIDADSLNWLMDANNFDNDRYLQADMYYISNQIDTVFHDVGFRLRGNTSRRSRKKSFKISLNSYVENQEFYGLKKINLNGEHNDPTICRSKLNWDLFNQMEIPSSRCLHTKLFINDIYMGLYVNVEEYNKFFLNSRYANSGGNLYKCRFPSDLSYLGESPDLYKYTIMENERVYSLQTNEEDDDYSDLAHLIDVINNTPNDTFEDSLEANFNVWSYLKVLATEVLIGHWDNYWFNSNNYFLYNNPATGKFDYIPYDLDNTYGIWWNGIDETRDWGNENIYDCGNLFDEPRPLVDRIMEVNQYKNLYSYFVNSLLVGYFNSTNMDPRILELRDLTQEAAEDDIYRTYDYGWDYSDYYNAFTQSIGQHVEYGLTEYVTERNSSASSQLDLFNVRSVINDMPAMFYSAHDGILSVGIDVFDEEELSEVLLVYMNGSEEIEYQMVNTGLRNDGLVDFYEYQSEIVLESSENLISFYIQATDIHGEVTLFPKNAPEDRINYLPSLLRINELMASNDNTIADEAGEYDDWVELYNMSDSSIDINGYYLSDNPSMPNKWAFPDTSIDGGSYLLVWADNDEEQGALHTPFKLDRDGEFIGIYKNIDDEFVVVDSLSFAYQITDISWGRYPDGGNQIGTMAPSPGESNGPLGVNENESIIIKDYVLSHPYPNPFNSTVVMDFELKKGQKINLSIYNLEGRLVEKLVDNYYVKGLHRVTWQAENISSGVYFIKFSSNQHSISRKITLIK